ncbi:MAG: hypothetical protein KGQ59_02785 [Bdellovibrionales bacterium]|nr:hypothetical protein [Bdellovibrionales bacterium]
MNTSRYSEDKCKNLFQEFCDSDPDFGASTYTDPTGEVWLDSESEAAVREADKGDQKWIAAVFSQRRNRRISEIEKWVKQELIQWVHSQSSRVFNSRDKQELIWRLRATRIEFPDPSIGYPDDPELLLHSQALYERTGTSPRGLRRIRFGGAYVLGTSSRYNLAFTMAHELAHAIDPCELRSTGWAIPAFDRLSACFTAAGVAATPKNRVECRRNDQLSETFADWVAVQVASRALVQWGSEYPEPQRWASVGNSIRDLCEEDDGPAAQETHPNTPIRIEKILGTNPVIREFLGCPASEEPPCRLE